MKLKTIIKMKVRYIFLIQSYMNRVFAGLLFIWGTFTLLIVESPTCWANKLPTPIPYTVSQFSQIPFGQTIIGQIVLPKNSQLCDTEVELQLSKKEKNVGNILLVKRGSCNFTQKVINGQKLGADLVIIYDDKEGNSSNVIMKDDGLGELISIPSLFISNADGLSLQPGGTDCEGLPIVKVAFDIQKSVTSELTFWLDSSDRKTYILAQDFYKNGYFKILHKKIEIKLRFKIQNKCWMCRTEDCFGHVNEKYCLFPSSPQTSKGEDIILESLRQYFLWEQMLSKNASLWWQYMAKFDHNICLSKKIDICSQLTMKEVGLSALEIENIQKKVRQTITAVEQQKENILKSFSNEAKQNNIFFYPKVLINKIGVDGRLNAPELFTAICASLLKPPYQCTHFKQGEDLDIIEESALERILLILGFDNDKALLLQRLKEIFVSQFSSNQKPYISNSTEGKLVFKIQNSGVDTINKAWINFVSDVVGIIYLVDSSNIDMIEESRIQLKNILSIPQLSSVPILILGNNFDKAGAITQKQFTEKLDIDPETQLTKEKNPLKLLMCSVMNKKGYVQGFKWLINLIK